MKKLFIYSLLFISFVSCRKEIDLKKEIKDSKPVVSALFTVDSVSAVYLTLTKYILDTTKQENFVTNATVNLYVNDVLYDNLLFQNDLVSHYKGKNLKVNAGDRCKLEVNYPGLKKPLTSQVVVPDTMQIISFDTTSVSERSEQQWGPGGTTKRMQLNLKFKDNSVERNYYLISMKVDSAKDRRQNISHDSWGKVLDTLDDTIMIRPFNYYEGFSYNDPIVEVKSYYGNNFSIVSNENSDNNTEGRKDYANSIYCSDQLIDGKEHVLTLDYFTVFLPDPQPKNNDPNQYFNYGKDPSLTYLSLNYCQITEEHFKYIKSLALYQSSGDIFTEKVSVYSNIENGLGLFRIQNCKTRKIVVNDRFYK